MCLSVFQTFYWLSLYMYLISVLFLGLFFQLQWPAVDMEHGIRENKMLYKFAYLPAGLFNRAQVSLVLRWIRRSFISSTKWQIHIWYAVICNLCVGDLRHGVLLAFTGQAVQLFWWKDHLEKWLLLEKEQAFSLDKTRKVSPIDM